MPVTDVYETDGDFVFELEVPGYEDLEIEGVGSGAQGSPGPPLGRPPHFYP